VVFGGIHCLGWNVLFQGRAIWRAASLAIVFAPVSILLLFGYVIWSEGSDTVSGTLALLATFPSFFVYIVARVILIVLILMSFRSLPPGVYNTVAWTEFIPHV
jgi:hypothetical protein